MNSSIKPHVYKVKKTNRVSYIYVSFLQKSPTLSVSLAERDKQLSLCLAFSNLIRRPGCLVEMIYTYRHIHVDTWFIHVHMHVRIYYVHLHVYSCIYICIYLYIWHDSFICVILLVDMCDKTPSCLSMLSWVMTMVAGRSTCACAWSSNSTEWDIWMSHVTQMNQSCHSNERVMYAWVMSHIWMSHVTQSSTAMHRSSFEYVTWITSRIASHTWMSHVTHVNESCHSHESVTSHTWMSHVTHMNESCQTHESVTSHTWMSHVTHVNESCHTHEWVTSHTWMRLVTHMNESRHTHEWVTSHTWMSHVTHMNESCHTHEWVTSHTWMCLVTHINESRHTHEWVTSHTWMSHVTHINKSRHTHERFMSHSLQKQRISLLTKTSHESRHALKMRPVAHYISLLCQKRKKLPLLLFVRVAYTLMKGIRLEAPTKSILWYCWGYYCFAPAHLCGVLLGVSLREAIAVIYWAKQS